MISETLQDFKQRNIRISIDPNGKLKVDSPEPLDSSDYDFLKAHKPEIISELGRDVDLVSRVFQYVRNKAQVTPEACLCLGTEAAMRSAEKLCEAIYNYRHELITHDEIKRICDGYIDNHIPNDEMQMVHRGIELFSVQMAVNGREVESEFNGMTMTKFQGTIGAGIESVKRPGVKVILKRISEK